MPLQEKQCSKCGEVKPYTQFHRKKSIKSGYRGECKACAKARTESRRDETSEYLRQYYQRNKERIAARDAARKDEIKERKREYREKHKEYHRGRDRQYYEANRAWKLEWQKQYQEANREQKLAYNHQYYAANREALCLQKKEYAQANPEKVSAASRRRRARMANAQGSHSPADIEQMYRDQGGLCAYCEVELGDKFHVDHMTALRWGGTDYWDNLAVVCPRCNTSKNAKSVEEYIVYMAQRQREERTNGAA